MRTLYFLATGVLLVATIASASVSSNREQDRTASASAWREYRRHKLLRDPGALLEQRNQLSGEAEREGLAFGAADVRSALGCGPASCTFCQRSH